MTARQRCVKTPRKMFRKQGRSTASAVGRAV